MSHDLLTSMSSRIADVIAAAAPSVVQVQGRRRRPGSGVVFGADTVITTLRALGRDDGVQVRRDDGVVLGAELAGWDPATTLAVLQVPGLDRPALGRASETARVGEIGIAVARSWSNSLTASAGIVSVLGGPLPTGGRHHIDRVIRTDAVMHDGFSGGAFLGTDGTAMGIATAAAIRRLGVIIPASIAWKAASLILEHGTARQGYLGIAGIPVTVPEHQRAGHRDKGVLVISVSPGSPAAAAGLLVGDVVVQVDETPIDAPEDLMHLLAGDRVGREMAVHVLRGGALARVPVRVEERPRT